MSSGSRRPRAPGGPPSTSQNASPKKGSVRAARERMGAGQREPPMPFMPEPPRFPFNGGQPSPQPSPRSANFPPNIQIPPPSPGPAPSAPLPSPGAQWPLVSEGSESPPPQRREPPQRPPRPSYVPSMLDPSRQDQGPSPQPPSQSQPDQWDEDFLSPTTASSSRPLTTSSTGSVSSLGSIPDFPVPVPVIQQTPRRSPNIGPPPSARRGPSSYYSQTLSYVSPIAEESEQSRSHGSYASSNVIPRGHSAFYLEDGEGSPTDDEGLGNSGRSSRAEDHTDQSGLVRQASLGKKHKPALTTIKSTGSLKSDEKRQKKAAKAAAASAGFALSNEGTAIATPSSFSSGTAYLDESSSGSSDSVPTRKALAERLQPPENVRTPSQQARDSDVNHVLEGLQKGGAIDNDTAESMKPGAGGLATRVGQRRPPRLDVDAVKEAETRGSLTSLPDLIRRATKLASNLDRGKTASRLGMDWFTQDSVDQGRPRNASRRSGSLSDMLNNFPSPGVHTPTGEKLNPMDNHRMSQWPNPHGYTPSPLRQYNMSDEKPEKKPRRCCGMRLWIFIGLLIILLILIAAAVVIPIALIVLPNDGSNNTPADTSNAIASCNKSNPCQNGGQIVLNSQGQCSCVCSNGFTGAQCTKKADNACTTMPIQGVSQKSTVGFAVVPLLNQADDAFGVPLNASIILSQFSTSDVSCSFENALVTFNGQTGEVASNPDPLQGLPSSIPASKASSGKDAKRTPAPAPPSPPPPPPTPIPSSTLKEHRVVPTTSNGLIVAATATTKSQKTESSPSPAPSNSGTGTGTGTMSTGTPAEQRLDFARVAVLFILQQAGSLEKATTAQEALQQHFKQVAAGSASASDNNVDAQNGFTVDFDTLAVRLPGGGSVGGWGR